MTRQYQQLNLPAGTTTLFKWLAVVGAASFVLGLLFAPQRAWSSFLLVNIGLLGMGLGAALFITLQYVCGAHWAVAIRRVPEAMCGILPWAAIGILLTLLAGKSLFPWTSEHPHGMKGIILDYTFVLARAVVFLGLWLWLAKAIVARSRRQDQTASVELSASNKRLSAVFPRRLRTDILDGEL